MQYRVLVVDDDAGIAEFISKFLSLKGFETSIADSGEAALDLIPNWQPHLVLMDYMMPGGIDGIETLRRIRETDDELAVMMITGSGDLEMGREALRLGASDYITKPLDLEYLETSVLAKMNALLTEL